MSDTIPQSVSNGCRKYVKSRIIINTFNTFNNVELNAGLIRQKNTALVDRVLEDINMIPISSSLKVFAKCKAHLRKIGKIVDDADILIGATAIDNKFVMVTENIKHFENLPGITLENWVKR